MESNSSSLMGSASAVGENPVNRAAQGAHVMVDRVAEKAGPAVDRLRSGISDAAESLKASVENLGEIEKRWVDDGRGYVREHPLTSIGLAVAAGVVLGRFIIR